MCICEALGVVGFKKPIKLMNKPLSDHPGASQIQCGVESRHTGRAGTSAHYEPETVEVPGTDTVSPVGPLSRRETVPIAGVATGHCIKDKPL